MNHSFQAFKFYRLTDPLHTAERNCDSPDCCASTKFIVQSTHLRILCRRGNRTYRLSVWPDAVRDHRGLWGEVCKYEHRICVSILCLCRCVWSVGVPIFDPIPRLGGYDIWHRRMCIHRWVNSSFSCFNNSALLADLLASLFLPTDPRGDLERRLNKQFSHREVKQKSFNKLNNCPKRSGINFYNDLNANNFKNNQLSQLIEERRYSLKW